MYKQKYLPFLEITNYNPFNNIKSNTGNYIYFKYTNTIVDNKTEFTHRININNVATNVDVNVLFVGGGGDGGNANKRSGGGAGGGGGEVLLSKFKLSNITDNILKFKIGNVATQTQIYNTKPTLLYTANSGKKGGNGSSKKGDGGDSYNGLPKRNIDSFTSGLGSGVGGAGGSYTVNGNNGSTANLASGVVGGKIGNSFRDPYYITINLNDGTGNINTSYGGRGNQGQEDGYNGEPGYLLIYYIVNNNIQNNLDNTFYFGYNPIGKYFPVNYTNSLQEWCYIYLNTPGVVDQNTINNINALIGNNSYNILAVGGGGGGGKYEHIKTGYGTNQVITDYYGGGGGAGGECKHLINTTNLISNIKIGTVGNKEKDGTSTIINFINNTIIESVGGSAGMTCSIDNILNNDIGTFKFRAFGGCNSQYTKLLKKSTNTNKAINNFFTPSGGAGLGVNLFYDIKSDSNIFLSLNEFDVPVNYSDDNILIEPNYNIQSRNQIDQVETEPIKKLKIKSLNNNKNFIVTPYEIYKGDIPHYKNNIFLSQSENFIVEYNFDPNTFLTNYVGAFGKGYYQDKSPDGLMTRTEVNSNYDSTASPYRNGNIITYNFNNKVLSDTNTNTNIIISKGGDGGDLRYKRQGSGNDGRNGSPGFILIWFKRSTNVLF